MENTYELIECPEIFFEDLKAALKKFNKKNYEEQYEFLKEKYKTVLDRIEAGYLQEADGRTWLITVSENVIRAAEKTVRSKKWKYQQRTLQYDCNLFLVTYLLPLIQGYKGSMAEPFAEILAEKWNQRFGTQMKAGTYEQIQAGFTNTILGIKIGK